MYAQILSFHYFLIYLFLYLFAWELELEYKVRVGWLLLFKIKFYCKHFSIKLMIILWGPLDSYNILMQKTVPWGVVQNTRAILSNFQPLQENQKIIAIHCFFRPNGNLNGIPFAKIFKLPFFSFLHFYVIWQYRWKLKNLVNI